MFKKLLILSIIAATTIGVNSYAGNLYLGPALFLTDNTSPTSNYRGLRLQFFAGYSEMLQDIYLGGEVFVAPVTATIGDNHSNGATSSRSTRSYGISFMPGSMITEHILGFARVGVVSTEFPSPNTSRTGAQVGVGMQTCLTPYWDLRAEYIFTAYKTVPAVGAVKTDQVGLSLVYKVIG